MGTPGLFMVVVIGLLAGAVGRGLLGGRPSRFAALAAGVAGALAGPPIAEVFGYPLATPWSLALAAVAGATALLGLARLLARR
jgi:uncharacterized membrane protein YeaQ/YmgE (transglycosylase-associated protein family)